MARIPDKAVEVVADRLAKWFDSGRDWGNKPITKSKLAELEQDATRLLSQLNSKHNKVRR